MFYFEVLICGSAQAPSYGVSLQRFPFHISETPQHSGHSQYPSTTYHDGQKGSVTQTKNLEAIVGHLKNIVPSSPVLFLFIFSSWVKDQIALCSLPR